MIEIKVCPKCKLMLVNKYGNTQFIKDAEIKYAKLEKENAELKAKLELAIKQRDLWVGAYWGSDPARNCEINESNAELMKL